ncbi:MAG: DsbA family protein [Rhizobiaceae bacterium]
MSVLIRRRTVISAMAVIPAAGILAACNGEEKKAETPEAPATPEKPSVEPPADQGSVDTAKLLADAPMEEKIVGEANAPVTIIEYASMTCPHCASFHNNTWPAIKEKYVDTGKARLIFREFGFDPRAEAGFMLARCSGDNYFAMIDVLFKQQETWSRAPDGKEALLKIARLAGFSQESFEACLTDQKLLDDVRAVKNRGANEFRVDSTPTFFINGKKYTGALSVGEMSAIIDSM